MKHGASLDFFFLVDGEGRKFRLLTVTPCAEFWHTVTLPFSHLYWLQEDIGDF